MGHSLSPIATWWPRNFQPQKFGLGSESQMALATKNGTTSTMVITLHSGPRPSLSLLCYGHHFRGWKWWACSVLDRSLAPRLENFRPCSSLVCGRPTDKKKEAYCQRGFHKSWLGCWYPRSPNFGHYNRIYSVMGSCSWFPATARSTWLTLLEIVQ
jgi:hypothetical protein